MKAIRIHAPGGLAGLKYEEVPVPQPGNGEVLVQVYASGLSPAEITWASSTGQLRPLPAILGFELSGVVVALGEGVEGLSVGSEVYGLPGFTKGGTHAEFVTVQANDLTLKPVSITHNEASAVPLSALTAWQALFDHANLVSGQTVLIHGAAGGVGNFAVQLAKLSGAKVIATASGSNRAFLLKLGADEIIDYTTTLFEETVYEVDVVVDTVGGDTLERSWQVLKKGGILVTIASFNSEELNAKAAKWGVRVVSFVVTPNREELARISELIDSGQLKPEVEAVFPLSEGIQAYEKGLNRHNRGKSVIQIIS